jgi:type IV pilus assembly protein PilA
MAQWYYVDGNKQRIGPMDANVLVDALRHGQLTTSSMVWQEGMPVWQPLSMHFDALGVPESMRVRAKEKSGNAGMWIVVIVVVGFFGIAVLGILAAIAIPAYQDYTVRAKLTGAINEASAAKLLVSEHLIQHSECPNNSVAESQMPTPESYASTAVQKIDIGALENGNCAVEVTVSDKLAPGLITGSILFELTDPQTMQWHCYSESIQNKYLPSACRDPGR